MSRLTTQTAAPDEPTGASLAWTSADPIVIKARDMVAAARFAEADGLLSSTIPTDATARQARSEMREIIRRIRSEHTQTADGLLATLRKSIPDVSADDLERWRKAGEAQFRIIDGRVCYFNREPSNIFRFCDEAKRRRDQQMNKTGQKPHEPKFVLEEHLADVVAAAEQTGQSLVLPMRHRNNNVLTIPPGRAKVGQTVRCWLPFPQEHPRQTDVKLISASPGNAMVTPNRGWAQRTVYLEQKVADTTNPIVFKSSFEHTAYSYYPMLSDAAARPLPADYSGGCLNERPPHIRFTPALRDAVAAAVGDEKNPLVRARKIFEWVCTNIRYCAEEEYCTIPSFSEKALASRKGDCGIQSMIFVTMCRGAGIPARWQSGWDTRPTMVNMHDWTEFYVEPWGWLPADPSYGLRQSEDWKIRWFYFGHIDSYRMIVNFDYGYPLNPPKQSLRSEPADFQRGEVEVERRNLYFDEWDFDMEIEWTSVG